MLMLSCDEIDVVSGGIISTGNRGIVTDCFGGGDNSYDGYDADEALDALIQFLSN
jgi:hypothetical protein